jgi:hypothetical protein
LRVFVLQALDIRAAVRFELGFDPVQRLAIALGALAAVTELRQALDGRLVLFQVELADQCGDRIAGRRGRGRSGGLRKGRGIGECEGDAENAGGSERDRFYFHEACWMRAWSTEQEARWQI